MSAAGAKRKRGRETEQAVRRGARRRPGGDATRGRRKKVNRERSEGGQEALGGGQGCQIVGGQRGQQRAQRAEHAAHISLPLVLPPALRGGRTATVSAWRPRCQLSCLRRQQLTQAREHPLNAARQRSPRQAGGRLTLRWPTNCCTWASMRVRRPGPTAAAVPPAALPAAAPAAAATQRQRRRRRAAPRRGC